MAKGVKAMLNMQRMTERGRQTPLQFRVVQEILLCVVLKRLRRTGTRRGWISPGSAFMNFTFPTICGMAWWPLIWTGLAPPY